VTSPNSGFTGYLDLTVGMPDPVTGQTAVDITGASTYISLDLNPDVAQTLCIRPIVPIANAGRIDCHGTSDLGSSATQDHRLGEVGVDGFTAADCINAGGTVEAEGAPHPNVCNSAIAFSASGESASGAGALQLGLGSGQGLVAEFTVETALPCGDEGLGTLTSFGFTTALARSEILDVNNDLGESFEHERRGENFACHAWTQENGPGRLVLNVPTLHGFGNFDAITVFVFED
jgi:hypothetical protein